MHLPILDISYKSNLVIYDLLCLASSTQRVFKFYPHWGMYQNSLPSRAYFIVWIRHTVFIYSPEDGHLGFFSLLATMDSVAMDTHVQVFV